MSRDPRRSAPPLEPAAVAAATIEPPAGLASVADLLDLLPEPRSLAAGSWLAVEAEPAPAVRGLLARLLARGAGRRIPLAVRCTALFVRGYGDVSADDLGTAWGRVRPADGTGGEPGARARR